MSRKSSGWLFEGQENLLKEKKIVSDDTRASWRRAYLSPVKISLLAVNAVCFGGCVVLGALGCGGGPLVLLTVGTGLSFAAGLTGAIMTARRMKNTSPLRTGDRYCITSLRDEEGCACGG